MGLSLDLGVAEAFPAEVPRLRQLPLIGLSRLLGKLPDGNAFTGGGFIGRQGELLIFQLLYRNGGSLVGQLGVQKAAVLNDNSVAGLLSWSKPVSAKDTLYRNGFAPVSVEVKSSTSVFQCRASAWTQTNYVKASHTSAFDHLGIALDFDGHTLVTGASGTDREPFSRGQVWTFQVK